MNHIHFAYIKLVAHGTYTELSFPVHVLVTNAHFDCALVFFVCSRQFALPFDLNSNEWKQEKIPQKPATNIRINRKF